MAIADTSVTKVLVPTGCLGAGALPEHIQYGIDQGAHCIAADAGSTDSGPAYLARSMPKMVRESIKADLLLLMQKASEARIPLLIGSSGTCGTDSAVDWTADIAQEVARELGIRPKIALLYSEQSKEMLKRKNKEGKIRPLPPMGALADEVIDSCDHIVALMGPEPYIDALRQGADIVLGGRTTDTAVLGAVALMRGADVAATWHASKTAECGGQCTVNPRTGGVMFTVGKANEFLMEPLNLANRCSPESVSAHMLYETSNPLIQTEPGGVLDVSKSIYTQWDDRIVKVTHSEWTPQPYTMKLEGAGSGRFQAINIIGIEDPEVLANLKMFEEGMLKSLHKRVADVFDLQEIGEYDISLRIYGWNGVSGMEVPAGTPAPREVGVMAVFTCRTQELANKMGKACINAFFHTPLHPGIEMPSYAMPFSPGSMERGPLYEFKLNHVVETADGMELVRTRWIDMRRKAEQKELANA